MGHHRQRQIALGNGFVLRKLSSRVMKCTGHSGIASSVTGAYVAFAHVDEHVVRIYNVAQDGDMALRATFGSVRKPGRSCTRLRCPMGVGFTAYDTVLIADKSNCRIVECDLDGRFKRYFRTAYPPQHVQFTDDWVCYVDYWVSRPRLFRYGDPQVQEINVYNKMYSYVKAASICTLPTRRGIVFALDAFRRSAYAIDIETSTVTMTTLQIVPQCIFASDGHEPAVCYMQRVDGVVAVHMSHIPSLSIPLCKLSHLPCALVYNVHLGGTLFKDARGHVCVIIDMWQRYKRAWIDALAT